MLDRTMPGLQKRQPAATRTMPTCPFGHVIYDAVVRRNLGYQEAIDLVNAAAETDGARNVKYNRTSLTRWLTGTIPAPRTQRWVAVALEISPAALADAADAQRAQRHADQGEDAATEAVAVTDHPTMSAQTATVDHGGDDTERRDVLRHVAGTAITIIAGTTLHWLRSEPDTTKRLIDPLAVLMYPSMQASITSEGPPDLQLLSKRATG